MVDISRSVIEVAFDDPPDPLFPAGVPVEGGEGGTADDDERASRRPLEDRLAVVTGAGGLLGASLAAELVGRGARVCLVGRDVDDLRMTIAGLGPGARVAMLRCDLASTDDVESAADFVERIGAPVDLLVHAAGLHAPSTISAGDVDDLDEHYLLDVRGPYLLTQRLLPSLVESRGRVVFFTSPSDAEPTAATDVHQIISQAGMEALASALGSEVAPRGVQVLKVRTDGELALHGDGPEAERFLGVVAATVLDVLGASDVDVTDLHLRAAGSPTRSERR